MCRWAPVGGGSFQRRLAGGTAEPWPYSNGIFLRHMLFKVVKFAVETCKALEVNSLEPVKVALRSRYAKSSAILGFPPELAVGAGGGGARLLLVGGTLRALRAVTPRGSAPGRPPLHGAAGTSLPPHGSWECRPGNSEDRVSWLGGTWGSLCHPRVASASGHSRQTELCCPGRHPPHPPPLLSATRGDPRPCGCVRWAWAQPSREAGSGRPASGAAGVLWGPGCWGSLAPRGWPSVDGDTFPAE